MNRIRKKYLVSTLCITAAGIGGLVGSIATAQSSQDPAGQPQMQLPPGWTEADVQACMVAGTPGEQHAHLAKGVGVWDCTTTMWMYPGAEPMVSDGTNTLTSVMDGRFVKCEIEGEMPGMGAYKAVGYYGYDNVTGQYVSTFIDNHSSGIMNGVGSLSSDGKALTWQYRMNCPINKKPATIREVETILGPNSRTLEMFGADPKTGEEFKMMKIEMTRKIASRG